MFCGSERMDVKAFQGRVVRFREVLPEGLGVGAPRGPAQGLRELQQRRQGGPGGGVEAALQGEMARSGGLQQGLRAPGLTFHPSAHEAFLSARLKLLD